MKIILASSISGAVCTLRDCVYRDPFISIQHPLEFRPSPLVRVMTLSVDLQGCHFGQHPMEHFLGRSLQVSWAFFFRHRIFLGGFSIDAGKFLANKNLIHLILPCFFLRKFWEGFLEFLSWEGNRWGGLLFFGGRRRRYDT